MPDQRPSDGGHRDRRPSGGGRQHRPRSAEERSRGGAKSSPRDGGGRGRPTGNRGRSERDPAVRRERPGSSENRAAREPRGPELPEDLDIHDLDVEVRRDLRGLSKSSADEVAQRLVAAGMLLETDPAAALAHAEIARELGGRIGAVREVVGVVAYHAEAWKDALRDLRAAYRMTARADLLPMIADCERGLGRPAAALEVAQSEPARKLTGGDRAELALVEAGARRDLGQHRAALVVLEAAMPKRDRPEAWSARLWYAYADTLAEVDRLAEAREWFAAAAEIDDGETDAADRASST